MVSILVSSSYQDRIKILSPDRPFPISVHVRKDVPNILRIMGDDHAGLHEYLKGPGAQTPLAPVF